jgi:hypothetical protein
MPASARPRRNGINHRSLVSDAEMAVTSTPHHLQQRVGVGQPSQSAREAPACFR